MNLRTVLPFILDYYDREVSQMISQKYGYSAMDAYKMFMFSKTYEMLSNPELQMWDFSCLGIFDMWEAEQRTGDPRNSIYIQRC
jgi:hypothetical protein